MEKRSSSMSSPSCDAWSPLERWTTSGHRSNEALQIQAETQTLASITYQNFFLLYLCLAGMTGTAKTEEVEFEKTYKLETTIVPTNRVRARQDWADQVYKPTAMAGGGQRNRRDPQERPVLRVPPQWKRANVGALLAEQEIPQPPKRQARMLSGNPRLWLRPVGLVPSPSPPIWRPRYRHHPWATAITWLV